MRVTRNRLLTCMAALSLLALCAADVQSQQDRGRQGQPGGGFGAGPSQGQGRFGGGGQGRFGGRGMAGGGFMGGGAVDLLLRRDVQQELELVESQTKSLEALREEQGRQLRDMFSGMQGTQDLSQEERAARRDKTMEQLRGRNAALTAKIQEILLPHQFTRYEELNLQLEVRRGLERALNSGGLAGKAGCDSGAERATGGEAGRGGPEARRRS